MNLERANKIDQGKLDKFTVEYSVPTSVGLRLPRTEEQASNPEGFSAAFHLAFLEIGIRLPLQPYVLREIGVASAQLNPNAWRVALACFDKRDGEPLITELPYSNKEWKKTWFISGGEWGKTLRLGGKPQRVRSVFNIPETKKLTDTLKERMADKGRVDAEKKKAEKKKRMIVVSEGPSLVGEDTAHGPLPLLRPTIADRPTASVGSSSGAKPLNLETGVAYLCVYRKDLLRNREMSGYRKMSSVDRICHGQANMLQAIGNLLYIEKNYGEAKMRYKRVHAKKKKLKEKLRSAVATVEAQKTIISQMSTSCRKAKSSYREKQVKLLDYQGCITRANDSIRKIKTELGDDGFDLFMDSEEFCKIQEKTFDRAVKDIRTLLARSYSNFDFFSFDEDLKKATDSRVRKLSDLAVDKSENFSEESLSDKESGTMSSDDDDDDERFVADLALEKGKRTRHS
ncbi:hypothetical protein LWI28_029025 [Acer negundo]|uniref:Uncharacterized protein n=1 Tax=Acer negundo TaxID=4023 RepID=A0AAD5JPI1_ACENE|nr:hypothetical protein LWI28_029025 [Acer negundo]